MKLIKYTLNSAGEIPIYVINGGYFPVLNTLPSPQNWDFIGWAEDAAPEPAINNLAEYLTQIGATNWINKDGTPFVISNAVNFVNNLIL